MVKAGKFKQTKKVAAEKVKQIKKEPKENAKKSKPKPKIFSGKILETPMVNPKKRAPRTKHQPLGELNNQSLEQPTSTNNVENSIDKIPMTVPMNVLNLEKTHETYPNADIINGQLLIQSEDGSYKLVYIDKQI